MTSPWARSMMAAPSHSHSRVIMKEFRKREWREAIAYAMEGGQALHLHNVISNRKKAPSCFRKAVRRGEMIAHLFDQDRKRLIATAKKFGVVNTHIERRGQPGQHIDLCGDPLIRAMIYCEDQDAFHTMFDQGDSHA
jgi:hypothetical protein